MKRRWTFLALSLAVTPAAVSRVWAVWPPETSMETAAAPIDREADRATKPVAQRLEDDERKLNRVLRDLRNDEIELRRTAGLAPDEAAKTGTEESNGSSVH